MTDWSEGPREHNIEGNNSSVQPAVTAGEGVVAETVQQIPVTEAAGEAELAATNSGEDAPSATQPAPPTGYELSQSDPFAKRPGEEGYVADINKAEAMAEVGDSNRTTAARIRQIPDENLDHRTIGEAGSELKSTDYFGHNQFRQNVDREINENFHPWDDWRDQTYEHPEDRAERIAEKRKEANEIAQKADERADRLEQWAGILHEHPVSESYKQEHPGVTFEPAILQHLAEGVASDHKFIEEVERMCRDLEVSGVGALNKEVYENINLRSAQETIDRKQRESLQAELQALESNPDTTQRQLGEFYAKYYHEALKPTVSTAALMNNLLEDVRSGRASESHEPAATDQSAA